MAARASGEPATEGDPIYNGEENAIMTITEMAVRLDRPGRRCSDQVMAAFPRRDIVRAQIERARELCWAEPRRLCRGIRVGW